MYVSELKVMNPFGHTDEVTVHIPTAHGHGYRSVAIFLSKTKFYQDGIPTKPRQHDEDRHAALLHRRSFSAGTRDDVYS